MQELGKIVKRERLRRGMRGMDLAYAIGKDPGYVTRMEHGTLKEIPDPAVIQALSNAIDVSESELLKAIGYTATEPAQSAQEDPLTELATLVASFTDDQRATIRRLLDRDILRTRAERAAFDAEDADAERDAG